MAQESCAIILPQFTAVCVIALRRLTEVVVRQTQMYWIGPLIGGLVAGVLYDLVFAVNASVDKAKNFFTKAKYDDSDYGRPNQPSAKVEMTESNTGGT